MLYRIAVCDDEQTELNKLTRYINEYSEDTGTVFDVSLFSGGEDLLEGVSRNTERFDIIFLDVEMNGISGLETAEKIREKPDKDVLITFITSYPEYMQDSFDVQAFQYLTKPVSYSVFERKLTLMLEYIASLGTNITVVSSGGNDTILRLNDIICIETEKNMTLKHNIIITTKSGPVSAKGKIIDYEKELRDKNFISVHRTVIVNMLHIKKFTSETVELSDGKSVVLSRRRASEVKSAFSKYMVVRCRR